MSHLWRKSPQVFGRRQEKVKRSGPEGGDSGEGNWIADIRGEFLCLNGTKVLDETGTVEL
jgi:hypothetical protein